MALGKSDDELEQDAPEQGDRYDTEPSIPPDTNNSLRRTLIGLPERDVGIFRLGQGSTSPLSLAESMGEPWKGPGSYSWWGCRGVAF